MIRTLIVSGGDTDKEFLEEVCKNNKFDSIIASDKGLEVLDKCNVMPNYIIGDFDSINSQVLNKYIDNRKIEVIKLNPEKDYTDTHMAIKLALELGSTSIIVLGAIGSRIDHILGNINVLKEALDKKVECKILDTKNEIQLINKKTILSLDNKYKYISLIPLTTEAKGVSLKGFKYELSNADISIGQSLGVSNEQIKNQAEVDIKEGILILIKSRD